MSSSFFTCITAGVASLRQRRDAQRSGTVRTNANILTRYCRVARLDSGCLQLRRTTWLNRKTCRSFAAIFAAAWLLFISNGIGATSAQELPVRLQLQPLSIRGRSSGPIPLRMKLEYNRPQILEGDLLLKIYNSLQMADDLMATIRYEGIVLQGQDYIFDTVLPPIEHSVTKQYLVVGWFETENGRIPLTSDPERLDPPEPHELLTIGHYERATLVCSCSGQREYLNPSADLAYLNRALSLDNYNPGNVVDKSDNNYRQPLPSERVQHFAASWDALDLPVDPLMLCSFDVVMLADGALSRLDDSQMKALRSWVEAGGSLCVLPNDDLLTQSHLQFLQTIFEDKTGDGPRLSLTSKNELLIIGEGSSLIINRTVGFGRATLLPKVDNLRNRLQGKALGQVVAHLWKLRSDSRVKQGEHWSETDLERLLNERGFRLQRVKGGFRVRGLDEPDNGGTSPGDAAEFGGFGGGMGDPTVYTSLQDIAIGFELTRDLPPKPSPLGPACQSALLPTGVKMVPTSIIALLLIAYVITIGPIDYFVLGFFRVRKYTWLVFPLVTAAFTALTVGMAHSYMETSDTGNRLTIIDLIEDGRAARQTEIEMQFRAARTSWTVEKSGAFCVPADINMSNRNPYNNFNTARPVQPQMHYSGRFPQKYTTTQNLSQWKPELTRTMTLSPIDESIPELPWNDTELLTTSSGRDKLRQRLAALRKQGQQIDAVVMNADRRIPLFTADGFLFSKDILAQANQWLQRQHASLYVNQYRHRERIPPDILIAGAVLHSATSLGKRDFFSLVSHVSPQGSASMEDLAILDPTDADQWLLMVAVRDEDDTRIYRRLFSDRPSVSVYPLPAVGAVSETKQ